MNKKISLGLAISLIAVSIAVTFILTSFFSLQSFNEKVVDVNEKAKKYTALQSLDNYVRENYFGEINEELLSDGILKGYVAGIDDKYSRYLTAEEYHNEVSDNSGNLVGLGITLAEDESGYIRIDSIINNSPAFDSGITEGDIIISVDGMDVKEIGFSGAADAMKGAEGSEVALVIRRDGKDMEYKFTRRAIEMRTVEAQMMSGFIGYIKITGFKENTPEQFIDALEGLTANGAVALVFDVRDNSGGLVSALGECLDPLLPEGIVAVAEYKDGSSETLIYSDSSELTLPMAVLVNENTASAAELFAASLHDFNKAEIVGSKTYGKGVMQSTTELDNGGAIVLTIAKYRTAFSECYDGIGLTPDVQVENDTEGVDSQYDKAVETVLANTGE